MLSPPASRRSGYQRRGRRRNCHSAHRRHHRLEHHLHSNPQPNTSQPQGPTSSPVMHEHINLYGRYDFTNPGATTHRPTPTLTNALKPLHFVQIFQRPLLPRCVRSRRCGTARSQPLPGVGRRPPLGSDRLHVRKARGAGGASFHDVAWRVAPSWLPLCMRRSGRLAVRR